MSRMWKWHWPSRTWKWALFTVAMINLAITGTLYGIDIKSRIIRTYPYVSVSPAAQLTVNHKRPLVPKYAKGSDSIGPDSTKGSYNYFNRSNIASVVKGINLMIVSYMRSGSSMNGKVFAENDENFFVHEPLSRLAPHHYLTEDKLCEVPTKHCRSDPAKNKNANGDELRSTIEESTINEGNDEAIEDFRNAPVRKLRDAAIRTLKKIYSCDLPNLDDKILRTIMFDWVRGMSKSGDSWNNFTTCYIKLVQPNVTDFVRYVETVWTKEFEKHKNVLRLLESPGPQAEIFRECLDKLVSHCQETKLRVTKVLRISLSFLPLLMREIPDLKVLFVIRDPRGIIYSRIRTDWYPIEDNDSEAVMNNIKSLCFKIQEDIKVIDKLKRDYPGRFLDYSLEDTVKEPIKRFRTIFRFSGLEMTDAYSKKIKEVFTEKPTFLNRWTVTLNPKYINWTQEYCHQGLKKYGFEKFN